MVKSIESPRHEFKLGISAGGWDFWDLIFRFTIRYLISNSPFNGSVYNRYREKRIEINKKRSYLFIHGIFCKFFTRGKVYIWFRQLSYVSFFSYSGNVGKFTRSVHTEVEFIFTIEGRNTNFGMAERGGGWRPEIFIVAMTTPLVRATVSINVIAICWKKNATKIRSFLILVSPSSSKRKEYFRLISTRGKK